MFNYRLYLAIIIILLTQNYGFTQDLSNLNKNNDLAIDTKYISKLSPQALELAKNLHVLSLIKIISENEDINLRESPQNFEELITQFNMLKVKGRYNSILFKASLEIDSFESVLQKEINQYHEVQMVLSEKANKRINMTNFASFWSNGALWAVAEAFDIPTYRNPLAKLSIVSGSTGILAGIIPSAFSLYSLPFLSSKQYPMENDPNMLAPLFNYQIPPNKQYPLLIWKYLNHKAIESNSANLTRREILINNWIKKGFILNENNVKAKETLDIICSTVTQKKGFRLTTLGYRESMLSDVSGLVSNLKIYLQELIKLTTQ